MAETHTPRYTFQTPLRGVINAARFLTMAALLTLTPLATMADGGKVKNGKKAVKKATKSEKIIQAEKDLVLNKQQKKKARENLDSLTHLAPDYLNWLKAEAIKQTVLMMTSDTSMAVTLESSPLPGKSWAEIGLGSN